MATPPEQAHTGSDGMGGYVPTWQDAEQALEHAEMFWLTSLGENELHTVPIIGVWWEGALYACSPRSDRKHTNLKANSLCQALTGHSVLRSGLDIAIHGHVEEVEDMEGRLRYGRQMAAKYDEPWRFEGTEEDMWVFKIVPTHIRAFHRFNPMTYARWDVAEEGEK